MTNRNSATYGSGIFGLDPGARDTYEATQRLGDWIRERFAAPDYRPPVVPSVAIELQALSRDPEVDVKRVVALLEKDGLLAAQVLRLASSPVYATATPPRSLHEAVVRLGMRTLSDVVWEAVLRLRVFRVRKYAPFMESVRNHSCATAHVARALAAYTSLPAEYAFLCGLLHDIGTAAALIVVSEELPEAKLYDEVLGGTLAVLHEELSRLVTSVWKLPQELQLASGYHHTIKIGGYAHPLAALVYLAAPRRWTPSTNGR
jgi:HD-like signal output (HDOD) protein